MKEWLIRLGLVAALIGIGVWAWSYLHPSPEKVIRKRLGEMAQAVSFSSNEGLVAKAWNASKLGEFFTPDVTVVVDVYGTRHTLNARDELLQAAVSARSAVKSLSVQFPDIKVVVEPGGAAATVYLTARGKVSGERDSYVQELKMHLIKVKRDWLINQIETVRTLS